MSKKVIFSLWKRKLVSRAITPILALGSLFASNQADAFFHPTPIGGGASGHFERVANFPVYLQHDAETEAAAEIVAANEAGDMLVYSDSETESIGLIDIADPTAPEPAGFVELSGEPTSVAVFDGMALVGVNTSDSYIAPSGHIAVVDLDTLTVLREIPVAGQPDSIAVDRHLGLAAIVIENERDEDLEVDGEEGAIPQLPAGVLQVLRLHGEVDSWYPRTVDLTGYSDIAPEDPEPEFVDINPWGLAVVTLQENNHILVVNLWTRRVIRSFDAGTVDLIGVDTEEEDVIRQDGELYDVPREPDAVSWVTPWAFATANEGDYQGGSRGFTIFDLTRPDSDNIRYDSGTNFEDLATRYGQYPEGRSENKGSEPEGIESGIFDGHNMLFVGSERGNFVASYEVNPFTKQPSFRQVLPTGGVGPEGLLALPEQGLFVASNEKDDMDEGFRSTISIFQWQEGESDYQGIVSRDGDDDKPISWSALSGMVGHPNRAQRAFAVHDSAFAESVIYKMKVGQWPAEIIGKTTITDDSGEAIENLDPEGIARRKNGSFWIASEGKPGTRDNELLKVAANGELLERVGLPTELADIARKHGFEGVAVRGRGRGERVYVAFQRPWEDFAEGETKMSLIGQYRPFNGNWKFFYYPMDELSEGTDGWVGLSEITHLGGKRFAVIERDNIQGPNAEIKRVYTFSIDGVAPKAWGGTIPVLTKELARDLLPALEERNGWTPDKIEGLALSADRRVYVVSDNDAIDDATGETYFLSFDRLYE